MLALMTPVVLNGRFGHIRARTIEPEPRYDIMLDPDAPGDKPEIKKNLYPEAFQVLAFAPRHAQ